jgi:uncharacterized membrane protein
MSGVRQRWPAVLALVAALLGLTFGALSSSDYIRHLDRQVHDIHCSYIPGLDAESSPDNACRVAMYSPYAALFRDRYWGGVPISLFAVGAFGFFAVFALYLLLAGRTAPKRALLFLAIFGTSPLLVSILMATVSALKLGHFCKTCVGIYASSALLAVAGIACWTEGRREPSRPPWQASGVGEPPGYGGGYAPRPPGGVAPTLTGEDPLYRPSGALWLVALWAFALGVLASLPALVYVGSLPDYRDRIAACGTLENVAEPTEITRSLLHLTYPGAKQPATLFVDPLCPTCKALHQRLAAEGLEDQLDTTLVLFPLDSECNWMLDRPLHPGSCLVSKAILCREHHAREALAWAYDHQDEILTAAKAGAGTANVHAMIHDRFPGIDACLDAKETKLRLDHMLRYIVNNHLQVMTPQIFLGDTRLCDEDSDMGLSYTMRRLAPALRSP